MDKLDIKLWTLASKGQIVPDRSLLKTPEQIEMIKKSAALNTAVLDHVAAHIHAGMSTAEIDKLVYDFTTEHGGIPAPLNYEGFPKSVCTSINNVICHGIPSEHEILIDGDIINVDVSTILNGYFSDASRMFTIGEVSSEAERIVRVTKECVELGLKAAKPWGHLGDIAYAINSHAQENGYSVVEEIGGHGIGLEFHEEPFVSYVTPKGSEMVLVPGMMFTIEPMINQGSPEFYVDEDNGWTVYTDDDGLSAQIEYMVLIKEDGVEVLTKVLPELIKKAQEKNNVNDEGYFNEIGNVYRKIVVDKLLNADHLWTIYCDSTGYPYMVDDDIVVLYDYTNHARVEEQLGKYGYDISYGIEDKDSMQYEIAHLYRNGCRNIRFTDGKDNELIVSREEIGTYDQYIREDFVTNPGLQNALIKFFQEYRKPGDSTAKAAILRDKEAELKKAIRNADYMVPCTKEETDEEVSISHPYVDITDKVSHKEGEKVLALPVFTDGLEMEKCYAGKHEDMLYTYMELLKTVKELGASGIVINPLGVSYYVPVDIMKQLITM